MFLVSIIVISCLIKFKMFDVHFIWKLDTYACVHSQSSLSDIYYFKNNIMYLIWVCPEVFMTKKNPGK